MTFAIDKNMVHFKKHLKTPSQAYERKLWEKETNIKRTLSTNQHTHINVTKTIATNHMQPTGVSWATVVARKRNIQSPFHVTMAALKSKYLCWSEAVETKWLCDNSHTHKLNFIPPPPVVECSRNHLIFSNCKHFALMKDGVAVATCGPRVGTCCKPAME